MAESRTAENRNRAFGNESGEDVIPARERGTPMSHFIPGALGHPAQLARDPPVQIKETMPQRPQRRRCTPSAYDGARGRAGAGAAIEAPRAT